MMLEYENTMEDIVAFQSYHLANSPAVKQHLRLRLALINVALGIAIFFATGSWRDTLVPVTAGTLLSYLLLQRKGLGFLAQSQAKECFGEGKGDLFIGRRRLVLSEDTLNEESQIETHAIRYTALGEIKETPNHIFIYVNTLGAIVIARRDLDPLLLQSFIIELRHRMPPEQQSRKNGD